MKGIGVSRGVCLGKAFVYSETPVKLNRPFKGKETEEADFEKARLEVLEKNQDLARKTKRGIGREEAAIFEAHCSILQDEEMIVPIRGEISLGVSAVDAVEKVMNQYMELFAAMDSEYMKQRASDIQDIKMQLQRQMQGISLPDTGALQEPTVLIGEDIPPSVTAGLDFRHIVGLVMEGGVRTSHTAILARTMELPAAVGVKGILENVKNGMRIALDGNSGEVFPEPEEKVTERFRKEIEKEKQERKRRAERANLPCVTKEGKRVQLFGNIGNVQDAQKALQYGAGGIGLFRSEFLYLTGEFLPTEEQQYQAYASVLKSMKEKPVIVRTLDIGGDKEVPALPMKKEQNPFLGNRAIRLCRKEKEVFKTQLRALLRASVYGELQIMFPMISSVEELRWAKGMAEECRRELEKEGKEVKEKIPMGMMIEIPSAAVMAETFAKEADFFSIGTNDLTQYTLAADRGNEEIADLYTYFHPAVLKLIQLAIEGAHKNGKLCGMCGEAAGDKKMLPILLGLGLDEFSVSPGGIGEVKEWIGRLSARECRAIALEAIKAESAEKAEQLIEIFWEKQ